MPDVTLLTRDGATLHLDCPTEETVLSAAEAAGLFLPSMCHEGSCGLCRASLAEEDEEVLLCQCKPAASLKIALPYDDSAILRHVVPTRPARIETLTPAGTGAMAVSVVLEPDAELGQAADFTPGQYMEVAIPETNIRRAYSIANLPNWEGRIEFLIRLQPGGAFSTWLSSDAKPGDTLMLRGPLGRFVLDETSPRPRCLVGGGCGLAPLLSMLRHLAEFQDIQPTHLIFGANRESELFATEEVEALQALLPGLTVTHAVWRPEGAWHGFTGTAADALALYLDQQPEQPDIYVCGPPALMDAVAQVARARDIPEAQILAEQVQAR